MEELEEPDYRYILANERTYLAWVRTGLALIAGGIALRVFTEDSEVLGATAVGASLLGGGLAVLSFFHWQRVQTAMRRGEPLPTQLGPLILTVGVVVLAALVTIGVMI